jgi:uncharacterized membrane protein
MIKKMVFGFIWFLVIFILSYTATGLLFLLFAAGAGTNQEIYEAAQAFRNAYMIFFLIGAFILAVIGTVTAVLPGTKKKKPRAKKKSSTGKKARKKK